MKKYVNGFFSPSRLCLCLMLAIWLWSSACKSLQANEEASTFVHPWIVTATLLPGHDVVSLPVLPLVGNSKLMIDLEPTSVSYKLNTQAEAYRLMETLLGSGVVSRVSTQPADQ